MTTTTNYGYNVVEGTDQVNIQTQIAPNFTAIDSDLKDVSDAAITTATHTLAGTVHQLVRDDADRAVIRFVATADMATGDTFTVDGVSVTARLVNGEALQTGAFKINNCVECVLVGTVLNINAINPNVSTASDVSFDNTGTGLAANNVQDAIEEVKNDIPTIPASYAAAAITYNNTVSGLSATDVQYAIDEIVSILPTSGSVQITADGLKSYGQLFDQLYAVIDRTKLSADTTLMITEPTGFITIYKFFGIRGDNQLLKFGATWYDAGSVVQWATLRTSGSTLMYSSNFSTAVDSSSATAANGTTFTIKY